MSRRVSLEDFDGAAAPPERAVETPKMPEFDVDKLRSEAYEDGYKNGWDDCHAEHIKSESAVSSDLAQSLKDMEFTYREARADVLAALRPLIDAIISQLLPKLATDGLSAMVAKELVPFMEDAAELEPELLGAPAILPILQKLVDQEDGLSVKIRPEPSFSVAQVSLRLGAEARDIDLSSAVEAIGKELDQFTARLIADIAPKNRSGDGK
ncbi:MAG: hypothetical protein AAF689_11725 [Pseudomonadota bacterium]